MRKIFLLLLICLLFYPVAASTSSLIKDPLANEILIPLFKTGKFISLEDFMKLTSKKYKNIAGKKMSLKERFNLAVGKKYLRKAIRNDGTVDTNKVGFFGKWEWHWGGFFLGFFLSLIGVIITLFINDDYKWDRFWSAVKGALIAFAIVGIILAVSGGGIY